MRKFYIFTLLIACVTMLSAQQLRINPDVVNKFSGLKEHNAKSINGVGMDNTAFENWNTTLSMLGLGEMPDGYLLITGNQSAQKSSTPNGGSFALHLESNITSVSALQWTDTLVAGMGFIGGVDMNSGTVIQGEEYTEMPTEMTGYIQGELLGVDSAVVVYQAWNAGGMVAMGQAVFGAADIATDSYTQFTVPIMYDDPVATGAPDSAIVMLSSSGVGMFVDDQGNPVDMGTLTQGSYIEVDDFAFTGDATSVKETKIEKGVFVYPNPAKENITVRNANNSTVSVYNLIGELVLQENVSNTVYSLDISNLTEGTYIVKIDGKEGVTTKKISVL